MSETEQPDTDPPEQPDEDVRDLEDEPADHGGGDARDPARESAGQAADEEGASREGDERRATGHPDDAGEAS